VTHLRRFFLRFEENLAALCLGGLLVTLFLQVFTRFITRDPLSWTEEAARYLYVYVVFLGSSAAVTERTHVAIDFLVLKLPRAGRLALALLVNLCVLFVLANLFYWGIRATLRQLKVPALIVAGTEDKYVSLDTAQRMQAAIPSALLEVFDGIGHLPNLEAPGRFNAVLRNYLASLHL